MWLSSMDQIDYLLYHAHFIYFPLVASRLCQSKEGCCHRILQSLGYFGLESYQWEHPIDHANWHHLRHSYFKSVRRMHVLTSKLSTMIQWMPTALCPPLTQIVYKSKNFSDSYWHHLDPLATNSCTNLLPKWQIGCSIWHHHLLALLF